MALTFNRQKMKVKNQTSYILEEKRGKINSLKENLWTE